MITHQEVSWEPNVSDQMLGLSPINVALEVVCFQCCVVLPCECSVWRVGLASKGVWNKVVRKGCL